MRLMNHHVEHIGDATLYLDDCIEILPTLGSVDGEARVSPFTRTMVDSFQQSTRRDFRID